GADHIDANVKFRADVSPSLTLDGNLRYGYTLSNFDEAPLWGDSGAVSRTKDLIGSLGGRWANDDNTWFQTARLSVAKADIVTDADFYDAESETGRYKFSYQLGHRFYTPEFANSEHTVTAGYDLTHQTFANNLLFRSYERTANSFIGEYRGKFDNQFFLTA